MNSRRFLFILVLTVIANGLVILRVSGWGWDSDQYHREGHIPLRDGDLVLRCSRGLISDWFRKTNLRDRRFSHAGILIHTDNGPAVVHLSQDSPAGLKIESLGQFSSGSTSDLVGWAKTDLSDKQRTILHAMVIRELSMGRQFDDRFSLEENQKQYCTEWVRDVFTTVTADSAYFPVNEVDGFRYISPENLYINTHCALIRTFEP